MPKKTKKRVAGKGKVWDNVKKALPWAAGAAALAAPKIIEYFGNKANLARTIAALHRR